LASHRVSALTACWALQPLRSAPRRGEDAGRAAGGRDAAAELTAALADGQLAAQRAELLGAAAGIAVPACRQMWADAAGKDEATRELVRGIIDRAIEVAEGTADIGKFVAMTHDRANGAEPEPWEQVKAELRL
jgi:hypothetical protein